MHRDDWPVGEYAMRDDSPDQCVYCNVHRGYQHDPGCVIRKRTVVVKAEITYVIDVPEDWEPDHIEFSRNEGSWCTDNMLYEIEELLEKTEGCLCDFTVFRYVREATDQDEQRHAMKVDELPS